MADTESTAEIPVELRGREVSARLLPPFFEAVLRKGRTADDLAEGTGYSVAFLQNPRHRIAWDPFIRLLQNLGRALTDAELLALGAAQLDNPLHRTLLLPGRLLFSLTDIYRWGARPDSPLVSVIAAQDMTCTQLGERRLRFDVKIKPGYVACREFWILRQGFLQSVPRAFGLPPATVTLSATDTTGSYEIELPAQGSLIGRLRKRVSWLVAARDAAEELQRANDDLHRRQLELQREVEARKEAEEKLRSMNAQLEERVRERTRDLEEANRNLAATNAELTLFSASVAHDLRAPLRAINGFATALVEDHGEKLDADAKRHLDRVVVSAVRMGALIDSLLALSRITRAPMRRERVDLSEIANAVVEELRASEPSRVVEVVIRDGMSAEGDPALIRALMENLVANAWKFSRCRSVAHIEVRPDGDGFCVRDDGTGFDVKYVDDLFAPFHRLHTNKEYEGTGIGLAIVDRIVRRHGGTISVLASPDGGAAFSFSLAPR